MLPFHFMSMKDRWLLFPSTKIERITRQADEKKPGQATMRASSDVTEMNKGNVTCNIPLSIDPERLCLPSYGSTTRSHWVSPFGSLPDPRRHREWGTLSESSPRSWPPASATPAVHCTVQERPCYQNGCPPHTHSEGSTMSQCWLLTNG